MAERADGIRPGASDSANLMTVDGAATVTGQPSFTPRPEAKSQLQDALNGA